MGVKLFVGHMYFWRTRSCSHACSFFLFFCFAFPAPSFLVFVFELGDQTQSGDRNQDTVFPKGHLMSHGRAHCCGGSSSSVLACVEHLHRRSTVLEVDLLPA